MRTAGLRIPTRLPTRLPINLLTTTVIGLLALLVAVPRFGGVSDAVEVSDGFAHGVLVDTTNPRSMRLAREAGFTHAKMVIQWPRLEPTRGRPLWAHTRENDLDNVIKAAKSEGMKLVVRIDGVPDWAGGSPARANLEAVTAFHEAIARYARGAVVAYEILNEPNLPFEWGGTPSAEGYTKFMIAAYRGVKAGDPAAIVIGGGLSPGADVDDLDFLRRMYQAGARGHMDILGVHNYGGNFEPEVDPGRCVVCFRRAEPQRQIMLEFGDDSTGVWATEFGWLMDPGTHMGQYDWMRVSADQQAEYVVRSWRFARENWPWMKGMLLSNLDASTSPYHTGPHNGMPWFAILNRDHSPRPAYQAFKTMRQTDANPPTATSTSPPSNTPTATTVPTATPEPTPEPTPTSEPTPEPTRAILKFRVVKTDGVGLMLRATPGPTGARVKVVREGSMVEFADEEREVGGRRWLKVRDPSGAAGWVSTEYLAL
jgi:hypothetical protein